MSRSVAIVVVLIAALSFRIADATTVVAHTTQALFDRSGIVAVVEVQSIRTERLAGRLTTHVQVRITQAFKGAPIGTTLDILAPGGVEGGLTQRVEGAPEFSAGEVCVVFLSRVTDGVFHVSGLEQGKLALSLDATGQWNVHRTQTARLVEQAPEGGWRDAIPLPESEPAEPYFARLRQMAGASR